MKKSLSIAFFAGLLMLGGACKREKVTKFSTPLLVAHSGIYASKVPLLSSLADNAVVAGYLEPEGFLSVTEKITVTDKSESQTRVRDYYKFDLNGKAGFLPADFVAEFGKIDLKSRAAYLAFIVAPEKKEQFQANRKFFFPINSQATNKCAPLDENFANYAKIQLNEMQGRAAIGGYIALSLKISGFSYNEPIDSELFYFLTKAQSPSKNTHPKILELAQDKDLAYQNGCLIENAKDGKNISKTILDAFAARNREATATSVQKFPMSGMSHDELEEAFAGLANWPEVPCLIILKAAEGVPFKLEVEFKNGTPGASIDQVFFKKGEVEIDSPATELPTLKFVSPAKFSPPLAGDARILNISGKAHENGLEFVLATETYVAKFSPLKSSPYLEKGLKEWINRQDNAQELIKSLTENQYSYPNALLILTAKYGKVTRDQKEKTVTFTLKPNGNKDTYWNLFAVLRESPLFKHHDDEKFGGQIEVESCRPGDGYPTRLYEYTQPTGKFQIVPITVEYSCKNDSSGEPECREKSRKRGKPETCLSSAKGDSTGIAVTVPFADLESPNPKKIDLKYVGPDGICKEMLSNAIVERCDK